MTSTLTDYIKAHRATSVYVQPCLQLSENISSHSISDESVQKIIEYYQIKNSDFKVKTSYYYEDLVLEVYDNNIKCSVTYPVAKYQEDCLQLVLSNKYELSSVRFPLCKNYHHERQSLIYTLNGNGWIFELEILVPLILDPEEREKELSQMFSEDYDIISSSFRLYSTSTSTNQGKDSFKDEYIKLKKLIC